MSQHWTTKIRVTDAMGSRPLEIIERFDDTDTQTLLILLQASPGMFEYDGYSAYCGRPTIDPIRQQIVYNVELYGKVDA